MTTEIRTINIVCRSNTKMKLTKERWWWMWANREIVLNQITNMSDHLIKIQAFSIQWIITTSHNIPIGVTISKINNKADNTTIKAIISLF